MENKCHIPDSIQAFLNRENGGLYLILYLATPLTCMTVIQFHYIANYV